MVCPAARQRLYMVDHIARTLAAMLSGRRARRLSLEIVLGGLAAVLAGLGRHCEDECQGEQGRYPPHSAKNPLNESCGLNLLRKILDQLLTNRRIYRDDGCAATSTAGIMPASQPPN
jgi:hypothetical protein